MPQYNSFHYLKFTLTYKKNNWFTNDWHCDKFDKLYQINWFHIQSQSENTDSRLKFSLPEYGCTNFQFAARFGSNLTIKD